MTCIIKQQLISYLLHIIFNIEYFVRTIARSWSRIDLDPPVCFEGPVPGPAFLDSRFLLAWARFCT